MGENSKISTIVDYSHEFWQRFGLSDNEIKKLSNLTRSISIEITANDTEPVQAIVRLYWPKAGSDKRG